MVKTTTNISKRMQQGKGLEMIVLAEYLLVFTTTMTNTNTRPSSPSIPCFLFSSEGKGCSPHLHDALHQLLSNKTTSITMDLLFMD